MTARVAVQAKVLETGDMGSDTCEGRWKQPAFRVRDWTLWALFGMATERAALHLLYRSYGTLINRHCRWSAWVSMGENT